MCRHGEQGINLSCIFYLSSYRFDAVDGWYGGADDDCEGEEKPAGEEEDIVAEVRGGGPGWSTARAVMKLLE